MHWKVDIEIHAPKTVSSSLKKVLRDSATAALNNIPKTILKKKIRTEKKCSISIAIIDAKESRKLNFKYRHKNKATDVLSFSRMEPSAAIFPIAHNDLGDILICWSVAKKQALEYRTTIHNELARLTVHGVLHLFGYDHELSEKEEKRMFKLQDKILKGL